MTATVNYPSIETSFDRVAKIRDRRMAGANGDTDTDPYMAEADVAYYVVATIKQTFGTAGEVVRVAAEKVASAIVSELEASDILRNLDQDGIVRVVHDDQRAAAAAAYGPQSDVHPLIGTGATMPVGSDRYPCTVCDVHVSGSGELRAVVVQRDTYRRIDNNGLSEMQEYEFTPNPSAERMTFTWRRGVERFVRKGETAQGGARLVLGTRSAYQDPSF